MGVKDGTENALRCAWVQTRYLACTQSRAHGDLEGIVCAARAFWITEERVALDTKPLSHEETLFVTFLILHLSVVFRVMKAKMFVNIEGFTEDVKEFFSLPIPKTIWNSIKSSQDKDFVSFIEKLVSKRIN